MNLGQGERPEGVLKTEWALRKTLSTCACARLRTTATR